MAQLRAFYQNIILQNTARQLTIDMRATRLYDLQVTRKQTQDYFDNSWTMVAWQKLRVMGKWAHDSRRIKDTTHSFAPPLGMVPHLTPR
jgi:hypothetical protein